MRRKARLILLMIGLLLMLLLGLGGAAAAALGRTTWAGWSRTMVLDAEEINHIAGAIAHIDLPPGYAPEFGIHGLGFAMAAYGPGDDASHLMLIQIPPWLPMSEDAIIEQARAAQTSAQQEQEEHQEVELNLRIVEQREIDLGGHRVYYALSEGTNDEGLPYRSMQVFYPGRRGKIALLFEEPVSRWEDARAYALLASLR
ncbi:MAG TPA: hypothetical protein VNK95_19750 [Caldilineaceae bacterium]|nr:hypothetical protein [Caldilineaceae bacterium]